MRKRLLALLLAIAMIIGMLPVSAFAEEELFEEEMELLPEEPMEETLAEETELPAEEPEETEETPSEDTEEIPSEETEEIFPVEDAGVLFAEDEPEDTGEVRTGSGTCGEGLTWTLDVSGTLTISGTGEMTDGEYDKFYLTSTPWDSLREYVINVVIDSRVTSIGDYAFYGCYNMTSISLPEELTSIGAFAFAYCGSLTSITIPDKVIFIGGNAFYECKNLVSISLPDGLTDIYDAAFYKCRSLRSVRLPKKLTYIAGQLFAACDSLTSVTWPENLTYIGSMAFLSCTSLSSISFPFELERISDLAFEHCEKLKSVYFSGNAPEIAEDAFEKVTATAYYPDNDSSWTASVCQNYGGTIEWQPYHVSHPVYSGDLGTDGHWELADDTLTISCSRFMPDFYYFAGEYAPWHAYRNYIHKVVLSDSVYSVGYGAFYGCEKLESIEIPDDLRYIGDHSFEGCKNLKEIVFPRGVYSISDDAFKNSGLEMITFVGTAPEISETAFANVTAIVKYREELDGWLNAELGNYGGNLTWTPSKDCGQNLSWRLEGTTLIISGTGEMYNFGNLSGPWGGDFKTVIIEEGVTSIGSSAFWGRTNLNTVQLPSSLKSIGSNAFGRSGNLRSVNLPEGLEQIGSLAFQYCNVQEFTIPSTVTKIGTGAFAGNKGTLHLAAGNTSFLLKDDMLLSADETMLYQYFGDSAEVTISDGVECISDQAFASTNVSKVTIPNSVMRLEPEVFKSCLKLNTVIFGSGVSTIDRWALFNCPKLCFIVFQGSAPDCEDLFGYTGSDATIYYPENNTSWTAAKRDEIGAGTAVTWGSYPAGEMPDLTVPATPCGPNLKWTLEDGVLTISGEGFVYYYDIPNYTPWFDRREEIREIHIGAGVTMVNQYAFADLLNLETVIFAGCPTINQNAFSRSPATAIYNAADAGWQKVDFENIFGIQKWVPCDMNDILKQQYLNVGLGDSAVLELGPAAQYLPVTFTAKAAEGKKVPIAVDYGGLVTGTSVGTGYAVATVAVADTVFADRCRVDVSTSAKIEGVDLQEAKATVELFRTDYTTINVLLKLAQNMTANSVDTSAESAGSCAISSAVFSDPAAAQYFALRPVDDRTLEIVPTALAIQNGVTSSKLVKGSYKSAITVTVNGKEYTTSALALSVKQSKPSIKAASVKINSFTGRGEKILLTGGKVVGVSCENVPAKFKFDPEQCRVEYTGKDAKASAKLVLSADVENWAITAAVTVSVSVARTVPALKFNTSSVTMAAGACDYAFITYSGLPMGVGSADVERVMTNAKGKVIPEDSQTGEICYHVYSTFVEIYTNDSTPAGATYKLSLNYANGGKKTTLTIKTAAPQMKLKASGAIDTAVPNSPIIIAAPITNYRWQQPSAHDFSVTQSAKGKPDADVTGLFRMEWVDNAIKLTTSSPEALVKGCTYTARITADLDYNGKADCEASVKLNIKWSDPKKVPASVSIKAKGAIDVLRPDSGIALTATFKNWFTHQPNASDLQFYTGSGKTATPIAADKAPFTVTPLSDGYYIRGNGARSTVKYSVAFVDKETGISSKPVSLSVTMGKTKLTQSTKTITLFQKDRFSSQTVRLEPTDAALSGIARVVPDNKSKQYFSVTKLEDGSYAIGFAGNKVQPGTKTMTVKLDVFMVGNTTSKANATVSVKVNVK